MSVLLPLLALQGACYAAGYLGAALLARKPLRVLAEHAAAEDMDLPYGDHVAAGAEAFLVELERPISDDKATALLLQFCEWLDDDDAPFDGDCSHNSLIRQFGEFRRQVPDAWPKIR